MCDVVLQNNTDQEIVVENDLNFDKIAIAPWDAEGVCLPLGKAEREREREREERRERDIGEGRRGGRRRGEERSKRGGRGVNCTKKGMFRSQNLCI
jgi:hypothetical protein